MKKAWISFFFLGMLASCATAPAPVVVPSAPRALGARKDSEEKTVAKEAPYNRPYVVLGEYYEPLPKGNYDVIGTASWYGNDFDGKPTSSGEIYDMYAMTAAHKRLPIPSWARVTSLSTGRSVVVKINDRGPFKGDRELDLSFGAAKALGISDKGLDLVHVETIEPPVDAPQPVYFLDIGSFADKLRAKTIEEELKGLGAQAKLESVQRKGQTWFRVVAGPYREEKEAIENKKAIQGLLAVQPVISAVSSR